MPISCKYHEMVTINMANFQIAFSNFPNLSKAFRFVSMVNPLQYIYCYYNNWKLQTCLISYSLHNANLIFSLKCFQQSNTHYNIKSDTRRT